jgi:hypothetical protein
MKRKQKAVIIFLFLFSLGVAGFSLAAFEIGGEEG